jgi:hypothetical protein
MAEVSLSREVLRAEPAWLRELALAAGLSMLEDGTLASDDAARVESIAYDADRSLVSMGVRIMPALTNVRMELVVSV